MTTWRFKTRVIHWHFTDGPIEITIPAEALPAGPPRQLEQGYIVYWWEPVPDKEER